jgi:hypothetical protein
MMRMTTGERLPAHAARRLESTDLDGDAAARLEPGRYATRWP